jgi:hypothetical protein
MPGGLVFVVIAMRRELQATTTVDGSAGPTKAKKVRIWDEEDV